MNYTKSALVEDITPTRRPTTATMATDNDASHSFKQMSFKSKLHINKEMSAESTQVT